ncbi:hypothetical protein [Ferrovibrio sp.]|uniref:hypothetical protein n=1 Tax=Ferrovibrio sp. TaxID=1917215 RepID=UPI003D112687
MSYGINLTPVGPVASAFMFDEHVAGKLITGPFGSGKTISLFGAVLNFIPRISPSVIDGVRYLKVMVVRDTYPNLKDKTIPSYQQWLPRNLPGSSWIATPPPSHHLRLDLVLKDRRGQLIRLGPVDVRVEFRAVGPEAETAEDAFKGWEGNLVLFDEVDQQRVEALDMALGRVLNGRYPAGPHRQGLYGAPPHDFGAAPGAVLGAFNPPSVAHWLYRFTTLEPSPEWKLYRQPSGRSPQAENRRNSSLAYYERMALAWKNKPDDVRRFVDGEWGENPDGLLIYPEFVASEMVASEILVPDRGLKLYLGLDAGGTPAMAARQYMPNGQARTLSEIIAPENKFTGPAAFAEMAKAHLAVHYPRWRREQIVAVGDPSAKFNRDQRSGAKFDWLRDVGSALGIPVRPAPGSNNLELRLDAVRFPMTQRVDRQPGYLLSPNCTQLTAAYTGMYVAGEDGKPIKNRWSHIADGDQYAALAGSDMAALRARQSGRQAFREAIIANTDFRP